ncbi:MAG: dienelactone hydrolase family protein [Pseudomonadota bacterium]|nr:dienelactone hydrolase family protein [Pseudomonadota bacterium]
MHRSLASLVLVLFTLPFAAFGAVQTETLEYKDGDTTLKGFLVYDDAIEGTRPGVILVHEWWGLNDYARERAEMLAELGYVAFAVDMYGDNKVTSHAEEAGGWMKQITENVEAWQQRALLGLEILKKHELVHGDHLAAVGYCFGGATVMQMAYSGADLDGVVSFHGSLPPATPEQQKNIKANVLVAHGEADAFVPAERIAAFKSALDAAGVDWQMATYGGARHAFTNPGAGAYGIENLQYDEQADARSWALMQAFFDEIFAE